MRSQPTPFSYMAHPGGVTSLQCMKQLIIQIAKLLMLQAFPTEKVAQVPVAHRGILPVNFGEQGCKWKGRLEEVFSGLTRLAQ